MKRLFTPFAFAVSLLALMAHAQAQTATKLRVLFIGNSYTEYDNLPSITAQVAASAGDTIIYAASAIPSHKLIEHFATPATLALIRQGNWDKVVLQEHSQVPSYDMPRVEAQFFRGGYLLDSTIKAHNPLARTYLYITWGRRDGDLTNCATLPWVCTYKDMDSTLRLRYEMLADRLGAALSPVGPVRRRLRRTQPTLNLYIADGSHPTPAASYVAACTMYTALFAKNLDRVTYRLGVSAAIMDSIHKAATIVSYDSLRYWRVFGPTAVKPRAKVILFAYPNPTSGLLYLNELDAARAEHATLSDVTGRPVRTWIPKNGPLDMADLPAGVYQLSLTATDGKSLFQRIIKE